MKNKLILMIGFTIIVLIVGIADKQLRSEENQNNEKDDKVIRQLWDDFLGAIRKSDFKAARNYMHPESREWFDDLIKKLGDKAPKIADELSPGSKLKFRWNTGGVAEYLGFMKIDIDGTGPEWTASPIRFEHDSSGNWKIWLF